MTGIASRTIMLACTLLAAGVQLSGGRQALIDGLVIRVADGDTITVRTSDGENVAVRLHGVDAPEGGQDFSVRARQFTSRRVLGETVRLVVKDHDRWGRTVARVLVDGEDLSVALVRAGLAWHDKRFSDDPRLAEAERAARAERSGLWAHALPIPPWEYRHSPPSSSRSLAGGVSDVEYHGNVKSRVYHAPGCQHYNCKNCTAVFGSRDAAASAGYRPHLQCVR